MNVGDAGLISVVCSSMLSSLPTMVPRVSPTFGYNVNVQTSRPVNEFFKFEFFNMHLSLQLALMLK